MFLGSPNQQSILDMDKQSKLFKTQFTIPSDVIDDIDGPVAYPGSKGSEKNEKKPFNKSVDDRFPVDWENNISNGTHCVGLLSFFYYKEG